MTADHCSICKLTQIQNTPESPIVYQDDKIIVWQNMDVNLPGYFIISPIRHVTDYTKLNLDEATQLFQVTQKIISILQNQYQARKIYQCCFSELTPHLHYHLFPRYDWMETIPDIHDNGSIDGVKLFSLIRQHHLVNNDAKIKKELLDFIADFKNIINAC